MVFNSFEISRELFTLLPGSRFRQWPPLSKAPLDVFAEVGSVFVPIWVVVP